MLSSIDKNNTGVTLKKLKLKETWIKTDFFLIWYYSFVVVKIHL